MGARSSFISFAAAVCVAVLLPALLLLAEGRWPWLAWGAVAWVIAIVLKIPASILVAVVLNRAGKVAQNVALGLVSAASELGVAAAILVYAADRPLSTADLALFAVAAGATELLVLAAVALFAKTDEAVVARWQAGARASLLVRHTFFVERMIALAGHSGSRGLVGLTVLGGPVWAAAIAVVGFAATDGLAGYGQARGWDWSDPALCRRAFGAFAAVSAVELGAFLALLWSAPAA